MKMRVGGYLNLESSFQLIFLLMDSLVDFIKLIMIDLTSDSFQGQIDPFYHLDFHLKI